MISRCIIINMDHTVDEYNIDELKDIFGKIGWDNKFNVGDIVYVDDKDPKDPMLILKTEVVEGLMFCTVLLGEQVFEGIPAPVLVHLKGLMKNR